MPGAGWQSAAVSAAGEDQIGVALRPARYAMTTAAMA